eukprot:s270_g31.t1
MSRCLDDENQWVLVEDVEWEMVEVLGLPPADAAAPDIPAGALADAAPEVPAAVPDDAPEAESEVLALDVSLGANQNLHGRQLYAYVTHLARIGQIKIVLGGPPCRTFSRLRHQAGPGYGNSRRGEKRWRLENLTEEELEKVHGDSALVLKMMALYDLVAESPAGYHAFLMEHPSDPEDYLSDTHL